MVEGLTECINALCLEVRKKIRSPFDPKECPCPTVAQSPKQFCSLKLVQSVTTVNIKKYPKFRAFLAAKPLLLDKIQNFGLLKKVRVMVRRMVFLFLRRYPPSCFRDLLGGGGQNLTPRHLTYF